VIVKVRVRKERAGEEPGRARGRDRGNRTERTGEHPERLRRCHPDGREGATAQERPPGNGHRGDDSSHQRRWVVIESKSFSEPDETRTFPNGKLELVHIHDTTVGRTTFEPGWKWSNDVKPIAGTESCEVHHVGTCISGRMKVVHNDGTEVEIEPGLVYDVQPGHDGWVIGDEPCVLVDWAGRDRFAQR
jgi:hypothetical protein